MLGLSPRHWKVILDLFSQSDFAESVVNQYDGGHSNSVVIITTHYTKFINFCTNKMKTPWTDPNALKHEIGQSKDLTNCDPPFPTIHLEGSLGGKFHWFS